MASHPPLAAAARMLTRRPTIANLQPLARSPYLFPGSSQKRSITAEERLSKTIDRQTRRGDEIQGPGMSMRTKQTAEMMEQFSELLLPGTFVTPPLSARPSLFSDFKNRYRFEKARVSIKLQDLISRILARWWHREPFFRKDLIPSAEALHRNMYTAYASGDIETLSRICGRDLYQTFRNRILSRPQNVQFSWKFSKYNALSRVVSHRIGMLAVEKENQNNVRQAVVRIDSTQTLTKGLNGKVVKGTGEPTRTVEYLVLSKKAKKGEPETPWVVWGTVEESGMEQVRIHEYGSGAYTSSSPGRSSGQ
ncbi:hypothetical protein AA313_de0203280 [Arthrobotrys entomopaga]|nr:hypothetical protein AA313_de0203280 [Arthrobotrys entomopaga]